jgi:hypothetical protein
VQPDLVPCQLCEFDHLINKKKLEESDNFQDFITPVSKAEVGSYTASSMYQQIIVFALD